jgi:tRNA 2-thiouridine synthesizing protein C
VTARKQKQLLVVVRHSPYGSSLARASLDVALAAAAFEQPVKLLFMGDGVLQLLPEQDSQAIGQKNIGRLLSSLPLYDIDMVYADAEAVARHGIDLGSAQLPAQALDEHAMQQLMISCDHLLGF